MGVEAIIVIWAVFMLVIVGCAYLVTSAVNRSMAELHDMGFRLDMQDFEAGPAPAWLFQPRDEKGRFVKRGE